MPAERAPMRKVREVLRLRHALGVSERQIAVTIGVSRSTVGEVRPEVVGENISFGPRSRGVPPTVPYGTSPSTGQKGGVPD
jgi:transposase